MRKKKSIIQPLITVCVVLIYVAMIAVLIAQALTPGTESSEISDSVGGVIDDVITEIETPEAEHVNVEGLEILSVKVSNDLYLDEALTLYAGSTGKINCEVSPSDASNPSLLYESSNAEIVQAYPDGRIKALKAGNAVVTATSEENPDFSDSVTITVVEIAIQGIEITNLPNELHVGQTHALEIAYTPSNTTQKNVTWQSSNTDVLSVNNSGKLTAKAEGEATVTATSKANAELTESVTITVLPKIVEPEIPVEAISLTGKEVGYIGNSESIKAKLSPTGAKDGLVWSSSDETVATVSQKGVVTYLKAGNVTITAKCSSYDVENSFTITVKEVLSKTITLTTSGLTESEGGGYTLKIATSGKVEAALEETATVREIVFTSSDPEIVKIGQDGVIEALSEGTATITVSTSYEGETTLETLEVTVIGYTFSDRFENFALWVRKSFGHFGASLVLGVFAALSYYRLFPKSAKGKLLAFLICLVAGFAVAGITEIFQLPYFTTGRYCSFDDVLLDFNGYCCSVIPMYAIILLAHFLLLPFKRAKKRKN